MLLQDFDFSYTMMHEEQRRSNVLIYKTEQRYFSPPRIDLTLRQQRWNINFPYAKKLLSEILNPRQEARHHAEEQ